MKIFIAHYSGEQSDAEDIKDHLSKVFREQDVEVFLASRWESIKPGVVWEPKILDALGSTNALLVLMSIEALSKHWVNFEIGYAWAKQAHVLIFLHKGLTASGLPRPYSSLQVVDINNLTYNERMDSVVEAVADTMKLSLPTEVQVITDIEGVEAREAKSFSSVDRAWTLRPAGNIGKIVKGRFLVGKVFPGRHDMSEAAGLQPGETLNVRLHTGDSKESFYIQSLVTGELAEFFETVWPWTTSIDATLRLAAAFNLGDEIVPIRVIESFEKVTA